MEQQEQRYLLVHEDVDDWVVDGRCFGKEGRDGSQPGVQLYGRVDGDQDGEGCVRRPGHHEGHNHDHHHARHLPLWLLGCGQPTV